MAVGLAALVAGALLPVAAQAQAADPYEWAALGDSYTAGLFIGQPQPALGSPDRDGCDRTANSYPDLVQRALNANPPGQSVKLTDVSCGAAAIEHIADSSQKPISPVQAPADGWPEVAPQIERAALGETTDVVTIGVGGNTLGFADILTRCVSDGLFGRSCMNHYEYEIGQRYERVLNEYEAMLAAVHDAAPNAKVVTIGYPSVLPQNSEDCARGDLTELATIGKSDTDWLWGVHANLNELIKTVTDEFGDRFVDLAASSTGHDACQPAGTKWIEGICGPAADYWPTSIPLGEVGNLPCPEGTHTTLVHPNAAGHANSAKQVETAVRAALQEL
ncbi:SGNH/GDSL hydrolase family protein [Streptomyces sp. CA-256286]|uniref:SGNH/GDSL hydrolase family protein n=1 Tax=Streptomyces sp. CA-256286 TaxID=2801033 RepID=UPI001F61DC7F|nr:SGNH/GDSL hydrolase family protein [Streptomyces sp. CA-256286]